MNKVYENECKKLANYIEHNREEFKQVILMEIKRNGGDNGKSSTELDDDLNFFADDLHRRCTFCIAVNTKEINRAIDDYKKSKESEVK